MEELKALGEVGQAVSSSLDLRDRRSSTIVSDRLSSSREPTAALSMSTMKATEEFNLTG